jgi:hypothetical protein
MIYDNFFAKVLNNDDSSEGISKFATNLADISQVL